MQVKLKVMVGSTAGRELPITGDKFVIGRGEGCQLRPGSDSVSRQHCVIRKQGNQVVVQDLNSRNGTYVNGERLTEKVLTLNTGDNLRIGRLVFEVLIDYGLGGAKRPKVRDVKDAVARTMADTSVADADITDWLEQGDDDAIARKLGEPETRQFRLDETTQITLEQPAEESGDKPSTPDESDTAEVDAEAKDAKKKEYGKLPKRPETMATDSREAAADTLKKFFNRR